ncbi:MAG: PqqD family protein [Bacteroidales bacterium]|nr:PqqD family protein [Bacteroidales bacterium]
MRIKEGFKLRTMLGEHIVTGEYPMQVNFNKMVSLNETAAYLWEKVQGKDFTEADLAKLLLDEYEVDEATANKDAAALAAKWKEIGLIEG